MMLINLSAETIKLVILRGTISDDCERHASAYHAYPVSRIAGEGRAGFCKGREVRGGERLKKKRGWGGRGGWGGFEGSNSFRCRTHIQELTIRVIWWGWRGRRGHVGGVI